MNPQRERALELTRRSFFGKSATGIGTLALGSLLSPRMLGEAGGGPHALPKAKRIIYLFQSGGPAQMDLFDYKPELYKRFGEEVPRSVYPDDRKTTMSSAQKSFATAPSTFKFERKGRGGIWMSEAMPHLGGVADELCVIKSMFTEAINHDPAITFLQTGSQIPGRPSMGSWLHYGLGSESENLPAFVAMSSKGSAKTGQPLYDRLWGSGFLPSRFQGVKFRNQGAPVLDIHDPPGVDRETRRLLLDELVTLNELKYAQAGDSEIQTRISQYELAYRMQMSVPELLDFSDEPKHVLDLYGAEVKKQGKYAYNCLVARRLAERGVRFIQLFHQGWDAHNNCPKGIRAQCKDTDQATAGLLTDLKNRGMLDDTLVIWGGEFGRTIYSQGKLTKENYGRDHHPSCFSMWMAGAGVKRGFSYGKTDDYSVNVAENGVHVHDLQATILQQMGVDHEQLTFAFQGREYRLTDVHGKVVREILA
ncbi:MAG: DUF1501 domain-containing protein [Akkermansiaceae bacterium]